jgi:hypothetical protein
MQIFVSSGKSLNFSLESPKNTISFDITISPYAASHDAALVHGLMSCHLRMCHLSQVE